MGWGGEPFLFLRNLEKRGSESIGGRFQKWHLLSAAQTSLWFKTDTHWTLQGKMRSAASPDTEPIGFPHGFFQDTQRQRGVCGRRLWVQGLVTVRRGGQADRTPAIRGKRQLEAGRVAVSQAGKLLVTSRDSWNSLWPLQALAYKLHHLHQLHQAAAK